MKCPLCDIEMRIKSSDYVLNDGKLFIRQILTCRKKDCPNNGKDVRVVYNPLTVSDDPEAEQVAASIQALFLYLNSHGIGQKSIERNIYMKKYENGLLAMNLQFFAEDEGVEDVGANETEAADLSDDSEGYEADTESVNEEAATPQMQSPETNAAFANMRRELEASRRQQREVDNMFAAQYGHLVNPETQQPIRSARDYYEALAAQERVNARAQMQQSGIDPSVIDNMIANSPAVREAKAATAELNSIRAQQMVEADFDEVLRFDASKTSREDIVNDPSYQSVINYVSSHPGTRFSDAYKLVNFDRLSSSNTAAAKQAVINQVKGKGHLANGSAVTSTDVGEDIPANMLEMYKEAFPDRPMKELKALYNKALAGRR